MNLVVVSIFVFVYVALPLAMIWGWVRWAKGAKQRNLPAAMSLAAFILATASALLAIGGALYANSIGGFPFYDPRLMSIYRWGVLLSLTGLVLATGGVWRPSPLRWHALACSLGALFFWILNASGE